MVGIKNDKCSNIDLGFFFLSLFLWNNIIELYKTGFQQCATTYISGWKYKKLRNDTDAVVISIYYQMLQPIALTY